MKRVVGGGGESAGVVRVSEDLPGSSFRELDDVFLQTQARIWLGEVLHLRFNEETSMADLISDGKLLFQVSKILWKKLVKNHSDLKHSKLHIYEKTSSGKNDGRYLRYTKVDSFLKICQILGLKGVDLFTPSDVVEKRDTRKVCMCIRSLSIKSRSENLPVPDFDVVTYTIAMPNYMVGGICRNLLERSKSSNSNSSFRQKDELHYDSDEAESCLSEIEFETPKSKSKSNSNSRFDVIQSDLREEIGENFAAISEEKQRNSVSDSSPVFEKEISEINICHVDNLFSLPTTSSCESSVGDSWQGQDGNFTPESKLVLKDEVESEMEISSNRISDGEENSRMVSLEISSGRISDDELEKNEDIFSEELISDLIREYDHSNLEIENLIGDSKAIENEVLDLNSESEDSRVQNVEKFGDSGFSSENKFSGEVRSNLVEEFDDPNLENIIADFCEKIGSENEAMDLNSELDLDSECEVQDLNFGDLTGENVDKIGPSEFSSIQNLNSEIKLEKQGEKIEEKVKFVNSIETVISTRTEIKADDELETENAVKECENEDEMSEGNSRNKIQNHNLGQKVFTSVAGGVTLAGVLLIFLQLRKRSKERNVVKIGLRTPIKEIKEEINERNNIEIQKPKTVYPTNWLKI